MNSWCPDPLDLFRLAAIVHNDRLPETRPDAVYLFGHTSDNEGSVLEALLPLLHRYSKSGDEFPVYLCGGGPYNPVAEFHNAPVAYSGFESWYGWLIEKAYLDDADIHAILRPSVSHTGTEAESIVRSASQLSWKSLVVVAAHMHILRAFTNTVTFATRLYPELQVYAMAGMPPRSWMQEVLSSQGTVHGSILDTGIAAEWERLNRWHAKGDLIAAKEVLGYIAKRDAS